MTHSTVKLHQYSEVRTFSALIYKAGGIYVPVLCPFEEFASTTFAILCLEWQIFLLKSFSFPMFSLSFVPCALPILRYLTLSPLVLLCLCLFRLQIVAETATTNEMGDEEEEEAAALFSLSLP